MDPIQRSKLPTYGNKDGDQIVDVVGNIYEYNAEQREWVYKGIIPKPPIVDNETDGLISPDTFRKLSLLKKLSDKGINFSSFKLLSNTDLYYYLFHSSDDLIEFVPEKLIEPKQTRLNDHIVEVGHKDNQTFLKLEKANFANQGLEEFLIETPLGPFDILENSGNIVVIDSVVDLREGDAVKIFKPEIIKHQLRIEVDRNRLYQKLVRNCCVGPKGKKGAKGAKGSSGVPADNEIFQIPNISTGNVINWSIAVDTPIDTPISLRFFETESSEEPIIEIVYPLNEESTTIVINNDEISIEETSLSVSYDEDTKIFEGSLAIVSETDLESWRFKVRQQGPKGAPGDPGSAFLQIVTQLLDDPSVRSQEAFITMRKAVASDDIISFRASLFDNVPANNLAAFDGDQIINILENQFAAVKVTSREAKDIGFFQFDESNFNVPDLALPSWTPTKDCVQSSRWAQYKFNWFDQVDPEYLYHITPTPKPAEKCCQEDFFFCPNLGDACPVEGEVKPPRPFPVPCLCDCENPVSGQFFDGGLELDPIDLTDEENAVDESNGSESDNSDESNTVVENPNALISSEEVKASALTIAESVIDGNQQTFTQEITLLGNGEIRVSLDYDSDICGGIQIESQSEAFVDSDSVKSTITLEDPEGNAIISNDGIWETKTIPVNVVFTVEGPVREVEDEEPETQPGETAVPLEEDSEFVEETDDPAFNTTEADPVTLVLTVIVNTEQVNYCRGYRLTTIAKSDRTRIRIPRTFTVVPTPETVVPPEETETIIDFPDPTVVPPEPDPPFVPPDPFTDDGIIISIGTAIDAPDSIPDLISLGDFIFSYPINGGSLGPTGGRVFINVDPLGQVGQITSVPGPSQSPPHQDALNFNSELNLISFNLTFNDSGFDSDGLFGPGTYMLGSNYSTLISSVTPSLNVKKDIWTDTIAFFKQPESTNEKERLFILSRLDSSRLINSANSVVADRLFDSGLTEAVISIELASPSQSIYDAMLNKELVLFDSGKITISHFGSILAGYYPQILIEPTEPDPEPDPDPDPDPEPDTCVGNITNLQISADPNTINAQSDYEFSFDFDNNVPKEALFRLEFDSDIILDDVLDDDISSTTLDGSFMITKSGQQIDIERIGATNTPTGSIDLTVGDIVNPSSTGSYDIALTIIDTANDDEVCDGPEIGNVDIVSTTSSLDYFWVLPGDELWNVSSSGYVFEFAPNPGLPSDGVIDIEFPSDQDISQIEPNLPGSLTITGLDGTNTITTSGQVLRISRNGDGSDVTGTIRIQDNGFIVQPPSSGSRTYSVKLRNVGLVLLEESSFDVEFSSSINKSIYDGSQLAGSAPSGSQYFTDQFVGEDADAGCPLVGLPPEQHAEPANGSGVCEFDNIPINHFPDPDPSGCSYGRFDDIGASSSLAGIHERRANVLFPAQPCPWVAGNITGVSVTPDNLIANASVNSFTFEFTIDTYISTGVFILQFPHDLTGSSLSASSKTIPSFDWNVTKTLAGTPSEYTLERTGTATKFTLEPGTYDLTITASSGFSNPGSGSHTFGIETRLDTGEVIDNLGTATLTFS